MNSRFLLAPVAAFAVLTFAAPVSAQSADLHTQVLELHREVTKNRIAVSHIQRRNDHCEAPDPDEVAALMATANALSREASAIAPRVGGRDHVIALTTAEVAEADYAVLRWLGTPDICYVPPAE